MSRVLVTGATGFVGTALVARLRAGGHTVRAAVRRDLPPELAADPGVETVPVAALDPGADWRAALDGVDAVIHAAARVHQMNEDADTADADYHRENAEATGALARAAGARGVGRFVLVSTVKVLGEATGAAPFDDSTPPAPADPYGRSKLAAERALAAVAAETGMAAVALRPPLVYGPGVGANFRALMRLATLPAPLPLGAIHNRRSLIARTNLADALALAATGAPRLAAPGRFEAYLVSDGIAVSTTELVRCLGAALGRRPLLLPVPPALLRLGLTALGRRAIADRLLGSLEVDDRRFVATAGWRRPVDFTAALAELAAASRRG